MLQLPLHGYQEVITQLCGSLSRPGQREQQLNEEMEFPAPIRASPAAAMLSNRPV